MGANSSRVSKPLLELVLSLAASRPPDGFVAANAAELNELCRGHRRDSGNEIVPTKPMKIHGTERRPGAKPALRARAVGADLGGSTGS